MAMLLVTTIFGFASTLKVVHASSVIFSQTNCKYCPTDSVGTSSYTQSWKLGVKNNNGYDIYVKFTVNGVGNLGDVFTVVSDCIFVPAHSPSNNNGLTLPLTSAEIGETFAETYSAQWDTLFCNSLASTVPGPSDSFIVTYP
jgi:hypothetical protein